MDLREHRSTQQRHPWEVARLQFLTQVLRTHDLLPKVHSVLDAGSGDAWFAKQLLALLGESTSIDCWDAEYTPDSISELTATLPRQIHLTPTRPATQHDLVLLLDVLEHVADDHGFLTTLVQESLQPGGWLLFTVPAWQPLFSRHDTWLQHHRRYAPDQAVRVLHGAGLDVVQSGGLFHSLLMPRLLTVVAERLRPPTTPHQPTIAWRHGAALTRVVQAALDLDNTVSLAAARAGLPLPGLSFWALCQRPA
jgi:trans-aconitate methyltransferase